VVIRTSQDTVALEAERCLEDLASLTGWEGADTAWLFRWGNAAGILPSNPTLTHELSAGVRRAVHMKYFLKGVVLCMAPMGIFSRD
jgi:hypothetical protein